MADSTLVFEPEMLHDAFQQWQSEQETLDAEWNESLAALVAYQSHLDAWQQQLGRERDEQRQSRDEWERERAAAELNRDQSSAQLMAQLAEAHEQVSQLSEQLLTRTEELRELDKQRLDATTELERTRTEANQLAAELDNHKRQLEQAQAAATSCCSDAAAAVDAAAVDVVPENAPLSAKLQRKLAGNGGEPKRLANSPVLGSIVEQFGKLRQQRASERQAGKKQG